MKSFLNKNAQIQHMKMFDRKLNFISYLDLTLENNDSTKARKSR